MGERIILVFTHSTDVPASVDAGGSYNVGDCAGFPRETAERLITAGAARVASAEDLGRFADPKRGTDPTGGVRIISRGFNTVTPAVELHGRRG